MVAMIIAVTVAFVVVAAVVTATVAAYVIFCWHLDRGGDIIPHFNQARQF